jgi:hypothetical protein
MEIDPATAWNGLEEPWRVCLSLAWEAYGAGTIPVGAALVDAEGAVVAEGRNRVYEPAAPPRQLANSLLAHAEVNALLALDPERRYEDHVLCSPPRCCRPSSSAATRTATWCARSRSGRPPRSPSRSGCSRPAHPSSRRAGPHYPMRSESSGCISGAPRRSNWRNLKPARVLRALTTR